MRSLPGSLPGSQMSKGLGRFLRSIRCLLRLDTASAALNGKVPWFLLAPLPADCPRGPFSTVARPAGVSGVAAHGRLHTVNVSNRISLPRRKLTLLVPKGDPVAVKKLLVSQVSSLARLGKVSEKDARSCQDIIIAWSVSPNEFLPITGH